MKTLESREMRNTMEQDKIETSNEEIKPKKPRKKIVIARQLS